MLLRIQQNLNCKQNKIIRKLSVATLILILSKLSFNLKKGRIQVIYSALFVVSKITKREILRVMKGKYNFLECMRDF